MKEACKLETENCFDGRFPCGNLNEKENVRNIYLDLLGKAKERRVKSLLSLLGEVRFIFAGTILATALSAHSKFCVWSFYFLSYTFSHTSEHICETICYNALSSHLKKN